MLDGKSRQGRSGDVSLRSKSLNTATSIIAGGLAGFVTIVYVCFVLPGKDVRFHKVVERGFHWGYLNGLAKGINTRKQSDEQRDSLNGNGSLSKGV
eukprot:scaffold3046_cov105-Cylindrotheca_fusiformis.AAC.13